MADGIPQDIAKLGFEDALKELEDIVRALESGDGKLDDAIASYERGAALKKHCEGKLAEAKNRIERISFADDNAATTEPIDIG
ncbi:MAG: Exodeoxyribonuclease 7 small subunit [Alphaproteobacteria bacterium MarineAlpha10_Bin3]|jgi:exodeoxyribonuclease VII small subunit|nr:MAG: Exodeoxyribonuclease 7 small subunit [Alphaproteobacteria bacterium MarineAlpha10_Bin3]PPR75167.1 MAG: Exodeoxyribonuclease 7 small subunit [Alphaproteobacteria bacterium MarineAlpha4_Bin1]